MRVRASGGCCEDGLVLSSRPFTPKGRGKNPLGSSLLFMGKGQDAMAPTLGRASSYPSHPRALCRSSHITANRKGPSSAHPFPPASAPWRLPQTYPPGDLGSLSVCTHRVCSRAGSSAGGGECVCVPVTSHSQEHRPLLPCVLSTVWGC